MVAPLSHFIARVRRISPRLVKSINLFLIPIFYRGDFRVCSERCSVRGSKEL